MWRPGKRAAVPLLAAWAGLSSAAEVLYITDLTVFTQLVRHDTLRIWLDTANHHIKGSLRGIRAQPECSVPYRGLMR